MGFNKAAERAVSLFRLSEQAQTGRIALSPRSCCTSAVPFGASTNYLEH